MKRAAPRIYSPELKTEFLRLVLERQIISTVAVELGNREATLNPALAPLSDGIVNHRSARSRRSALSARGITGRRPAADTRFGSSNDATAVRVA